jgi:hypothetical protein
MPEVGFEPTRSYDHWILSPARLPIPPLRQIITKKAVIGFEPMIKVLQTSALPLGYTAIQLEFNWDKAPIKKGGRWESNPRVSEPQSDVLTTSPLPP